MKRVLVLVVIAMGAGYGAGTLRGGDPPIGDPPGRSGCCSHHKGVCGCAGNTAKCCDGTLSPSSDCG
jgi:hypothetical protein